MNILPVIPAALSNAFIPRFHRWLIACFVLLMPGLGHAASSLYLAFGTETRPGLFQNIITVSDLHGDHYHSFSINNGTDPTDHTPMPLTAIAGEAMTASIELGAMNIAPLVIPEYRIPDSTTSVFRLQLLNLDEGLSVHFAHGDHTHSMSAGSGETLRLSDVERIYFSVAEGYSGLYQADFKIVDTTGFYRDFASLGAIEVNSNFSILVNAIPVPEPSTVFFVMLSGATVMLRRRRRCLRA